MDNPCNEHFTSRLGRGAALLLGGLLLATSAYAGQKRDYLVGPVTLGPGDTLVVTAANVQASRACLEAASVQFVEHEIGDPTSADRAAIAVGDIGRTELGSAQLAPGKSARVRVRAGSHAGTKTVQVAVESERFVRGVDPCINIGGTVLRWNGRAEAVSGVHFADEFSILRPSSEAVCFGSSDCDDLLALCEQDSDCSFTCHIAIPNPDEQACVFGSTD